MRLISEQLRAELADDGRSLYELAAAAGVSRSSLGAFLLGNRGLTVDTMDKLAPVLGLRLVAVGRRRPRATALPRRKGCANDRTGTASAADNPSILAGPGSQATN